MEETVAEFLGRLLKTGYRHDTFTQLYLFIQWTHFFVILSVMEYYCITRFKTFNMQFEELHQRQSQWAVPDTELRESLRLSVAEVLLPAYRSFLKRFGCVFLISSIDVIETRQAYLK